VSRPLILVLAVVGVVLVLWVAYTLGKVLLRILVGCVALGLISWGIWHLLK
jgi:hypothetical protein